MTSDAAERRRWSRWGGGTSSAQSSGNSLRSTGTSGNDCEKSKRGGGVHRGGGLLGAVKKGVGVVWEKVTADHPEPLPVDKVRRVIRGLFAVCFFLRIIPSIIALFRSPSPPLGVTQTRGL